KARRIWLIDRQADAIAMDHREDLGEWIQRRLYKNVQKKEAEAEGILDKVGHDKVYLRRQWGLQKITQTSRRAHAPARLKRELNKVLQLQTEIDTIQESIEATAKAVKSSDLKSKETLRIIKSLGGTHEKLKAKAERLYDSLKIPDQFPELKTIAFEFLHLLLLARDLKIDI
ncbi:hypothetical protein MPER_16236, partial [Moniliophthora perniciosa FA553]